MKLQKILTIVALIIGVISFIMWIMVAQGNESLISTMIYLCQFLIYIAAGAALIFSIKNIASDGSKLKKTLISVGVFALIIIVGYGLSKDTVYIDGVDKVIDGAKLADTGLYTFYVLAVVALAVMLLGGVKKMTK